MASYVLTRFQFRGSKALLLFFISGMMIPAQLVLVPLFFQFSSMSEGLSRLTEFFGYEVQLHDSLSGLITIYIALSLPFTILVLSGFFRGDDALASLIARHLDPAQPKTRRVPFRFLLRVGAQDLDGDVDPGLGAFA